jgi:hypothetical protein
MDVAESTDPLATAVVDLAGTNRDIDISIDPLGDDGRSSSLSEIDDVSDNELLDDELPLPLPQPTAAEDADSEAETERLEDSPNNHRIPRNIKLSGGNRFESSPSKLAQSTTYDEMEEDDEHELNETPSKARRVSKSNGVSEDLATPIPDDVERPLSPPDIAGKKRKRLQAGEDLEADVEDGEPLRKRRSSLKDEEAGEEAAADISAIREETEEASKLESSRKGTPADDAQDSATPINATRGGKRGKKGKRKGRKARDLEDELENGDVAIESTEDPLAEDDEAGDAVEDVNDADAAAKNEEECKLAGSYRTVSSH